MPHAFVIVSVHTCGALMSWNFLSYHSFFDIHPAGVDVFDEPLAHRCPIGSDPSDNGLDLRNLRPPRLVTDFVDLTAPSVPVYYRETTRNQIAQLVFRASTGDQSSIVHTGGQNGTAVAHNVCRYCTVLRHYNRSANSDPSICPITSVAPGPPLPRRG